MQLVTSLYEMVNSYGLNDFIIVSVYLLYSRNLKFQTLNTFMHSCLPLHFIKFVLHLLLFKLYFRVTNSFKQCHEMQISATILQMSGILINPLVFVSFEMRYFNTYFQGLAYVLFPHEWRPLNNHNHFLMEISSNQCLNFFVKKLLGLSYLLCKSYLCCVT